jgi:hypothetical protein
MSLAAERERQELEEAMRLSLAEAESRGEGYSEAGPSRQPMSSVFEEGDLTPASRRVSSYSPVVPTGESIAHRRVVSDATGPRPPIDRLASDMSSLRIPGGSLMDDEDISSLAAPLQPQRTGAMLQSNNPFLSPQERDAEGMPQESPSRPLPATWVSKGSSFRDTPGSARTSYAAEGSKPLPPAPEPQYAPPPGPPPSHLRITSPTESQPPPLPPRTASVPWDDDVPLSHLKRNASHASSQARPLLAIDHGGEDPLETLHDFDTVFLVDDSTSMAGERWEKARAALMEVAEIAARYDQDGVDIYFINSKRVGKQLKAAHDVEDVFRGLEPRGATP